MWRLVKVVSMLLVFDAIIRVSKTVLEKVFVYSTEAKVAKRKLNKADNLTLQKIELYLEKYEHPSINEHGEFASGVPWIVIYHSGSLISNLPNLIRINKNK